jgi:hypothetical protein
MEALRGVEDRLGQLREAQLVLVRALRDFLRVIADRLAQ